MNGFEDEDEVGVLTDFYHLERPEGVLFWPINNRGRGRGWDTAFAVCIRWMYKNVVRFVSSVRLIEWLKLSEHFFMLGIET